MTKSVSLLLTAAALSNAAAQISLQTHYIPLSPGDASRAIAADSTGDIFILSALASGGARVTKTDPQGNFLTSIDLASLSASSEAVDPEGNLLVGGSGTGSLIAGGYAVGGSAIVLKLDNGLTQILSSATLGSGATGGSVASQLAADADGDVYFSGSTWDPNFPVTPGAYQTTPPAGDTREGPSFVAVFAFVTKLTPDLSTTIYSTFFGNSALGCVSETCYPHYAATGPVGIAVDSAGIVTLVGDSNSPLLADPSLQYGFSYSIPDYGFVARVSADGSSLEAFSTLSAPGSETITAPISAVALDHEGNLVLAGGVGTGLTFCGDAIQPDVPASYPEPLYASFVVKYDPALKNRLWGTYFGDPGLTGLTLDAMGNVWVTGSSKISELPDTGSSSVQTSLYVAEISADGSSLLNLFLTQGLGGYAIASTAGGAIAVLGGSNSFLLSGPPGQPSFLAVTSSANGASSGTIAPAELISLFGNGVGPASELSGQVVNGVYTNSLGGYQVLFGGTPAPLLYAGPDQINVVAPAAISGQPTVAITVVGPQGTIPFPAVFVAPAQPQLFSRVDPPTSPVGPQNSLIDAIAFNQDGTPNSFANPAQPGSIVTMLVTGLGLTGEQRRDGSINSAFVPYADLAVTAAIYGTPGPPTPLAVASVGDAPGAVFGVAQVRVQLPQQIFGSSEQPAAIQAGGVTSGSANLYIMLP
jgi:uncharacterized protein (TIGR03437 family)